MAIALRVREALGIPRTTTKLRGIVRQAKDGYEQENYFVCNCGTPAERAAKRAAVNPRNVPTDQLLWVLSQVADKVEVISDQWFGVIVEGRYGRLDEDDELVGGGFPYRTHVECDELNLGLMQSWEMWAAKYAGLNNGRRPWVGWEH